MTESEKAVMQQAYRLGFLRCAGWAQRDDLFADVDSPTYKKDCQHDLSAIAQPVEPATDKLRQIIAATYQIAGACDLPVHILDVLANPERVTQEQIDAMLPFVPPAEKAKLQWGQFVGCDLPTPAAFGPVAHCQRDQPFFSAQQMNDCVAADRVQRQAAQPTAERNFCPRCGKRLGGVDDIHTCTPVVDPKETK